MQHVMCTMKKETPSVSINVHLVSWHTRSGWFCIKFYVGWSCVEFLMSLQQDACTTTAACMGVALDSSRRESEVSVRGGMYDVSRMIPYFRVRVWREDKHAPHENNDMMAQIRSARQLVTNW